MIRTIRARGRLHGRRIELNEALDAVDGDVEVMVRVHAPAPTASNLLALVATFPPGARTRGDIDRQLGEERGAWDMRG